jgi:hypothetical protein
MEQEVMNAQMITPQIQQQLQAYAASLGFKPEEIAAFSRDMRLVQMALKAMVWDKLHTGQ